MKKSNDFFHLFEEEIMRKSSFLNLFIEKSVLVLLYSNFSLFFISSSINF